MSQFKDTDPSNLGWKYFYDYYRNLSYANGVASFNGSPTVSEKKKFFTADISFEIFENAVEEALSPVGKHGFKLATVYPGLLIGSGYLHEVGVKEELKLGFFFDHTTGLPVIPGSSVKGILRSAFKRVPGFVAKYIAGLCQVEFPEEEKAFFKLLKGLELEIFGPEQGETLERNLKFQDVFYDAVPVKSFSGKLLGEDNLTPHIYRKNPKMTPFKDPVPLPFLKIVPGVVFYFDFELHDSTLIPELNAGKKEKLFEKLLCTFGAGAKTNVGYGQFILPNKFDLIFGKKGNESGHEEGDVEFYKGKPVNGAKLYGKVLAPKANNQGKYADINRIEFLTDPERAIDNFRNSKLNEFEPDDILLIQVFLDNTGKVTDIKIIEKK